LEVARDCHVSESTVTRAAQALGYKGYPDLQTRFRGEFVNLVPERLAAAAKDLSTPTSAAMLAMAEDVENVRRTAELLDHTSVEGAVEALANARRIFIVGTRGSHGLAIILYVGLGQLMGDVRLLNLAAGNLPDQLARMDRSDALIAISFQRIDTLTLAAIQHASSVGAASIAITDSVGNPLARAGDFVLVANAGRLRLMPSFASSASIVNALVTAMVAHVGDDALPHLETSERLWDAFGTYVTADISDGDASRRGRSHQTATSHRRRPSLR
jgi:DNA-binding MurR/RpiR family transcriptional regulator